VRHLLECNNTAQPEHCRRDTEELTERRREYGLTHRKSERWQNQNKHS
jgi:hypothetical protein